MYHFSNPHISIAIVEDIRAFVALLNSAYRGESSKQGWTNEVHLIEGNVRIDEVSMKLNWQQNESVFLKYTNKDKEIIGCVNLQQMDNAIYLGLFSVSPLVQNKGIGKQILVAAEEYAKQLKCSNINMTVISARTELIDWYKRNGYIDTGIKKPFLEDGIAGKHLQPLEFMVLEKQMIR